MKNNVFTLLICLFLITSCAKDAGPNPFLVTKTHIGLLTDSTKVRDLETIFSTDSVVQYRSESEFSGFINSIEIYEKGGKKLLDLSPKKAADSSSVISSVRIIDERYKTEKKISVLSNFKELSEAYKISKIDNLINAIVISVNELNASFTIDKKELPASLRFDMDLKIDPIQIPEKAKIKYFMLHW